MKHALANEQTTEAMLEGLIAECHAMIRDVIRPAIRDADPEDARAFLASACGLMESAGRLGDAVGRLRGGGQVRQRITVERVEKLPSAKARPVPQLSAPRGEGG